MRLILIDLETSGLKPECHRIVDAALCLYDLKKRSILEKWSTVLAHEETVWEAADPKSLLINGYTPQNTAHGKSEAVCAREIETLFARWNVHRGTWAFFGQNVSFDRQFFSQLVSLERQELLQWPYHWLDFASMYFGAGLFSGKYETEPLSKDAIARALKLPPEEKPHSAERGVLHLLLLFERMLDLAKVDS